MGRVGVAPVVGGGQLPRELHSRHAQTLEPNPGAGSSTALEVRANFPWRFDQLPIVRRRKSRLRRVKATTAFKVLPRSVPKKKHGTGGTLARLFSESFGPQRRSGFHTRSGPLGSAFTDQRQHDQHGSASLASDTIHGQPVHCRW